MNLTLAQKQTLKADILADGALSSQPNTNAGNTVIAEAYNALANPVFWAWRTAVSRADIYNLHSPDNTDWDWTIYKGQGVAEQNAWIQMFMADIADFSKANLRAGIGKIFGAANANTTHSLAVGRRQATRGERLYATGTGTSVAPGLFVLEGAMTVLNIEEARNS